MEKDRPCVYLDVSHLPAEELDRKLAGILEIYQKFQGVDPRHTAMKIFPAVHYSMGGLWVNYQRLRDRRTGDRLAAEPADQHPRRVRHRRVRLPVSRGQSPGRQFALVLHLQRPDRGPQRGQPDRIPRTAVRVPAGPTLLERAAARHQAAYKALLSRPADGENPYLLHQQLGRVMTRAATVVRHNDDLDRAYEEVLALEERAGRCGLSDTSPWTNQNLVFTRALLDMFPLAKTILKGAPGEGRVPRGPLQARVRPARHHGRRTSRASAAGGDLVRAFRGQQPQMAQEHDRRAGRPGRAGPEL